MDDNGYMDISELPGNAHRVWPWAEWAKIPEGKMVEVVFGKGKVPDDISNTLRSSIRKGANGSAGLKVVMRSGRVFVCRFPKEPDA